MEAVAHEISILSLAEELATAPPILESESTTVRALNPDNHQDVERIIELFVSNYGNNHPFRDVYAPEFWLQSSEDDDEPSRPFELTSIVAEDGGRFVGHLAIRRDAHFPDRVEILLPAIHPAYRKHTFSLTRALWSVINKMAAKQGWRTAYHFSSVLNPACQLMSVKCFHSVEVALISTCKDVPSPEHTYIGKPARRASALLMYNVFDHNSVPELHIYPPARHLAHIHNTYSALRIKRIFEMESHRPRKVIKHPSQTSPFHLHTEGVFHGLHLVEIPTELSKHRESLASYLSELKHETSQKLVLALTLDDPSCPTLCDAVEKRGFRYCGLMPLIGGRDYILYSEYSPEVIKDLAVYSRLGKSLRTYLAENSQVSDLH